MTEFKDFPVSSLFKVLKVRHKLTKSKLKDQATYPCYSSSTTNYGVLGYTNEPEFIVDSKVPVYLVFGDHTRTMRIAIKSFSVLDNVKVLLPAINNIKALIYICAVWHKAIPNLGYARHWTIAKKVNLNLPVLPGTDQIDFKYMEDRVKALEEDRVKALANYLTVTGLDNYQLTEKDKQILRYKPTYASFKLGDLFEFKAIKQAKSQKMIPMKDDGIPYVVQSQANNMVSRYVDKDWLIKHNEPPVKGNCLVLGVTLPAVSYQPYEFGASQVITARCSFLNERIGLYFVTLLGKQMKLFSYTYKPGMERYKKLKIELPINSQTNKINFKYIEDRVKALEQDRVKALANYLSVTCPSCLVREEPSEAHGVQQ